MPTDAKPKSTPELLDIEKFGIGQPVLRLEDPVLVRGAGRYVDDIAVEGQVYAAMVRAREAHGLIRSINTDAARAMKGVLATFTQADLDAAGFGELRSRLVATNRDGTPFSPPFRPIMARDRVRFAGEVVACVVARTAAQAQDAAEAVEVEIEALPAITTTAEALAPDAPQLFETAPGNVVFDYHFGDSAKVAEAFARAAHVTRLDIRSQRLVVNAMEPRGGIAEYDRKTRRFTLHLSSQGVKGLQAAIAGDILNGADPKSVRVLTGNVGGSFGMKIFAFPEYGCLMHAARLLRRPVKWTDRRSESFVSDFHGRDHDRHCELALDAKGRFLALRVTGAANVGAYVTPFGVVPPTLNVARNIQSVYRTPLIEVHSRAVVTNTAPVGPYRGAGRPEGNYFMERLIETAAREMGIDSVTLRRRNHIPTKALPYAAASGLTYDSGDFPAMLDAALAAADWKGFARRKAESRRRGLLRGRGIGQFLEVSAAQGKELGGIRFDADGGVTILSGTLDFGVSHQTTYAQVVSAELGIPIDRIRLKQGDSDLLAMGGGSGGSRSMQTAGQAYREMSGKVIEKGLMIASATLETGPGDIEFRAGRFAVAGTDRSIGILELAARLREGTVKLPPDVPGSLDADHISDGVAATFPNGCHVAEVEVDPETGVVRVVRYVAAGDCGTVVNPIVVEGQVHGGVVQGIGQAVLEDTVYDENGQLLTGSFMDYAMPRAGDVPDLMVLHRPSPALTNALGIKGVGEAGCAGSLPAVMNAVVDALAGHGVRHIDMPASPARVYAALRAGAGGEGK